ncbi:MAG TPA: hypothetical protein VH599_10235 [Ktedonobacterales bacterium]|jgi:hypothetical protein
MAKQGAAATSQKRQYQPQTAAAAFDRLLQGTDPWVAIGDFLDDWRRSPERKRAALIAEPIAEAGANPEFQRWAAFFAGMVERLCWSAGLPAPAWTTRPAYYLPKPWYLYPGTRIRAWLEETTPASFKMRNIFGGDRMLDRV